jgi:threonine dehydrogenase-like Zn-dependent dehydrogenase
MKAAVLHAPYDIRIEELADPQLAEPTDAIIRIAAACVCGSDLWPYRGIQGVERPTPMGHEYCGVDLVLPLTQVAEGYRAMDERRAIKTLLRP